MAVGGGSSDEDGSRCSSLGKIRGLQNQLACLFLNHEKLDASGLQSAIPFLFPFLAAR
jgi:hypothetical protein